MQTKNWGKEVESNSTPVERYSFVRHSPGDLSNKVTSEGGEE